MSVEIQIERQVLVLGLIFLLVVVGIIGYKIINTPDSNISGMSPAVDKGDNPVVEMKTSMGTIEIELYPDKSPLTVENFLRYVEDGFYNGLIFHRVIDSFMIQGGGFEPGMKEKATIYPPIENEARKSWLENKPGTIAMARTNDPDSATSQFFINAADNTFLNPGETDFYGYAVFGKVISGMDVVESINKVKTHSVGMHQDVPVKDIVIESAKLKK
jgi:cyclophilin family peptidyl-prolyl cis-trans isomerase